MTPLSDRNCGEGEEDLKEMCSLLWPAATNAFTHNDAVVSELTDSVDDLGMLLLSTSELPHTTVYKTATRFPVIDEEDSDFDAVSGRFPHYSSTPNVIESTSQTSCSSSSSGVSLQASESSTTSAVPMDELASISSASASRPSTTSDLQLHDLNNIDVLRKGNRGNDRRNHLKRWSTVSITSTGTLVPADAVSCDCTSLAWSTFRPNSSAARRRRDIRQRNKSNGECYERANGPKAKSASEQCTPFIASTSQSASASTSDIPPLPKCWKERRRRTWGVFIGSMVRKIFEVPQAKLTGMRTESVQKV
jgi:hypothetical protein